MNRNRALWIVQGVLAVLFLFAGAMKLLTRVGLADHAGAGPGDASAFADLHRQRISGDEGERPGRIEWAVAERLNVLIEFGGHAGDL